MSFGTWTCRRCGGDGFIIIGGYQNPRTGRIDGGNRQQCPDCYGSGKVSDSSKGQ